MAGNNPMTNEWLEELVRLRAINQENYRKRPRGYACKVYWYARFWDRDVYSRTLKFASDAGYLEGKSFFQRKRLLEDALFWGYVYGFAEDEYFLFDFPHHSREERLAFLCDLDMVNELQKVTLAEDAQRFMVEDKWLRHEMFEPLYHRDVAPLKPDGDDSPALDFLKKHRDFIVKPNDDYGGHGVHLQHVAPGKEQAALTGLRKEAPLVMEELLVQSAEMASLNPTSVNTVRVTTFMGGGQYEIAHIGLRIGRADAIVDNITSGGLAAMVDLESHKTVSRVLCGGYVMNGSRHPDSGMELSGFELPDWDGLMAIIEEGVALMPRGVHYAGWDFCHTDKGWCLVECNDTGTFNIAQTILGVGQADYFRKTLAKFVALGD